MLIASITACSSKNTNEFTHTTFAFGTLIETTVIGVDEQLANTAFEILESDFHKYHTAWSPWENGSLSRINKLIKTGEEFTVSPIVLPLIKNSFSLSEESNNYYNPAIGKLIRIWQFHKHDDPAIKPPHDSLIKEIVAQNPKMSDLQLSGIRLKSNNTNVELNFGAYAKGFALEQSMKTLQNLGIENAIINAGGDLITSGKHVDRPWLIGIRHPRKNLTMAWLEISENESVFTSGDYERFYNYAGKIYHHILNPETGYPASGTTSVTVIHDKAGVADAAATAIFIAGPDEGFKIAKSMGIRFVMLVDDIGVVHMNPAMRSRIEFTTDEIPVIAVSEEL